MATFLRIEQRAGNTVAVFKDGRQEPFALDESNLRTRIANIEAGLAHPSRDASVEHAALAELTRRKRERVTF